MSVYIAHRLKSSGEMQVGERNGKHHPTSYMPPPLQVAAAAVRRTLYQVHFVNLMNDTAIVLHALHSSLYQACRSTNQVWGRIVSLTSAG